MITTVNLIKYVYLAAIIVGLYCVRTRVTTGTLHAGNNGGGQKQTQALVVCLNYSVMGYYAIIRLLNIYSEN